MGFNPDNGNGGDILLSQCREDLWEHHGEESFGEGREKE